MTHPQQTTREVIEQLVPDPQLCKFYDVESYPDLVAVMLHHINKLQAKLPPLSCLSSDGKTTWFDKPQSRSPAPAQPAEQPIKLYADSGNPDMFSRDLLDAAGNRYIVMTPTMTQFDIDDTALRAAGLEMKIDGLDPAPDGGSRAKMYWRKVDGAQPAEPVNVELVADMFWNDDDAERNHNSIDEFLNEEICNGMGVEVGGIFTLRRATSLPKIKIRVTSIDEEACEAEYEIIDALSRTQAAQPQHKEG